LKKSTIVIFLEIYISINSLSREKVLQKGRGKKENNDVGGFVLKASIKRPVDH